MKVEGALLLLPYSSIEALAYGSQSTTKISSCPSKGPDPLSNSVVPSLQFLRETAERGGGDGRGSVRPMISLQDRFHWSASLVSLGADRIARLSQKVVQALCV